MALITETAQLIADTRFVWNFITKTANYSAIPQDFVSADTSAGGFTVTLPPANQNINRVIGVKKISSDANAVTISPTGADTIDGAASQSITIQWNSISLLSNGTGWYIF
jgi:hypothetical protein